MRQYPMQFKCLSLAIMGAMLAYGQQNLIVKTAPGNGRAITAKYGLTVLRQLDSKGDVVLAIAGDSSTTKAFLAAAAGDEKVQSAERDSEAELGESSHDSQAKNSVISGTVDPLVIGGTSPVNYFGSLVRDGYANQPAAAQVRFPEAHSAFGIGSGIVAVIDTGVDPTHPVLAGSIVAGYDFINNVAGIPSEMADISLSTVALLDQVAKPQVASSQTPFVLNLSTVALLDLSTVALLDLSTVALLDGNHLPAAFGHGTMVSGLIHLAAPGTKIMPLKAFHADGSGNISDIVQAIYFAADHGAKVINMSFSSTGTSPALDAAIQYAKSKRVVSITSAGNSGKSSLVYPAGCGALGVASINSVNRRSFFSNYGEYDARTSAPGEALITAYPGGGYAGVWGTSFSTALVSGTAALAAQKNPRISHNDFSDLLDKGRKIGDQDIGDASLDALSMLQAVEGDGSQSSGTPRTKPPGR
jgi:hypothetical protein